MGEIGAILVLALIFLGPKKLPELASGLGRAIREIRKATADIRQEIELDDAIRKPLEELREATMLAPAELKRRDEMRKVQAQWEKDERERLAREDKEAEAQAREQPTEAATDEAPPAVPVSDPDKILTMPAPPNTAEPMGANAPPPPIPGVVPRSLISDATMPGMGPTPTGEDDASPMPPLSGTPPDPSGKV